MGRHRSYLRYFFVHKYWVFLACLAIARENSVPMWPRMFWRGLVHDLSKLRLSEWLPYARYFYNPDGSPCIHDQVWESKPVDSGDEAFDLAWLLHLKRNSHHWQWWVLPGDDGSIKVLEMPLEAIYEMVADWYGAGRARGKNDASGWYARNKDKMLLAPMTRYIVEDLLGASDRGPWTAVSLFVPKGRTA